MTALPNPFLSASDGLHPLSSVAVASGIPYKPQGAAAEIAEFAIARTDVLQTVAATVSADRGPAVATSSDQPRNATAGTNSAWVRDCDRIELQEIQSSCGSPVVDNPWPHGESLQQGAGTSSNPSTAASMSQGKGSDAASVANPQTDPASAPHQSPHEAIPVAADRLNNAEAASAPLLELHEFLGTGVQAPRPIGPWPRGFDPQAFLRAIEEAWIAGIDEPDPLMFIETFPLNAKVA